MNRLIASSIVALVIVGCADSRRPQLEIQVANLEKKLTEANALLEKQAAIADASQRGAAQEQGKQAMTTAKIAELERTVSELQRDTAIHKEQRQQVEERFHKLKLENSKLYDELATLNTTSQRSLEAAERKITQLTKAAESLEKRLSEK